MLRLYIHNEEQGKESLKKKLGKIQVESEKDFVCFVLENYKI